MTPFVIDASILASVALADEKDPRAVAALSRLARHEALAPPLLFFEIRNVLVVNERRNRLTEMDSAVFLKNLGRLPIRLDGDCDEARLLSLARKHRLSVYDATYLELALRARLPLATLDAELARAARAEGVGVVDDAA